MVLRFAIVKGVEKRMVGKEGRGTEIVLETCKAGSAANSASALTSISLSVEPTVNTTI